MKFQENVKNVRSFIKEQIEEKTFDFISSQLMPFCFIYRHFHSRFFCFLVLNS